MPIYEYRCSKCGKEFEEIRSSHDKDCDIICPSCGETKPEKKISLFGSGPSKEGGTCSTSSRFT